MKQTISTILASVMAVLAFDSTIVMADELTLRGSRDAFVLVLVLVLVLFGHSDSQSRLQWQ